MESAWRSRGRDEAIENDEALIVGAVLVRAAVNGGDARGGAENRAQQIGLRGVNDDRERGLRRQFEFRVIVVGVAVVRAKGARLEYRRRWCGIRTTPRIPRLAASVSGFDPAATRPAVPGRSEIERQVDRVRTRAVVAHRDVDLPEFGIGAAAPHADLAQAHVFHIVLNRDDAQIARAARRRPGRAARCGRGR